MEPSRFHNQLLNVCCVLEQKPQVAFVPESTREGRGNRCRYFDISFMLAACSSRCSSLQTGIGRASPKRRHRPPPPSLPSNRRSGSSPSAAGRTRSCSTPTNRPLCRRPCRPWRRARRRRLQSSPPTRRLMRAPNSSRRRRRRNVRRRCGTAISGRTITIRDRTAGMTLGTTLGDSPTPLPRRGRQRRPGRSAGGSDHLLAGLARDPEKCVAVFRKDHAQARIPSAIRIHPDLIAL
jgi:hypothetical protein